MTRTPSAGVMVSMGPEQLTCLMDDHAPALVLYARQWCRAAEDVVQEAFVKLSTQRPAPRQVLPWLYRVVRNAALDAARAERRRKQHENAAGEQLRAWFEPTESATLDLDATTAALEALPGEQREVIVAHLWGGLTFQQIAEVTGQSASSAHRCYVAGLATLRERIGGPCPKTGTIRS